MQRALTANALGVLKRHWQDAVIISALVLLSLWVRRLTLWDIEAGGDAIRKWFFVKQWSYANSFDEIAWNHHLARFGINFWAYVTQKIWGTGASVYFIAPVAAATAGVVFCYKLGQELGGRLAGLVAALWFLTLEPMERAGSQLLPEAFEAAYVAGAVYFLLWYLRYQGPLLRRRVLLALMGLLMFGAYLAKVSNLLFVPGIVLSAWFFGGNRRDVLALVAGLVACFLLETLWYNIFTQYSSQFAIISESHQGGTVRGVVRTIHKATTSVGSGAAAEVARVGQPEKVLDVMALLWKLLERYEVAWESIKFPLFMFLGTSLGLAVFAQQTSAKAVALIVFIQLFLTTFAIRQVSPIKVWLSNEPRYMIVLCPLLMATNAAFFVGIARRGVKQLAGWVRGRWALRPAVGRWSRVAVIVLAPLCAVASSALIANHYYRVNGDRTFRKGFPLRNVEVAQYHYSNAYTRGLPIVEKRSKDKKALRLVYSVYLEDRLIQRGDRLPEFEHAVARLGNNYDWLSKDPARYAADATDKLKRDRGCVYVTHLRGRYVNRTPAKKLPSNCRARTGPTDGGDGGDSNESDD